MFERRRSVERDCLSTCGVRRVSRSRSRSKERKSESDNEPKYDTKVAERLYSTGIIVDGSISSDGGAAIVVEARLGILNYFILIFCY